MMLKAANVLKDINLDRDTYLAYIDRRKHYLATTGMENLLTEKDQLLEQKDFEIEQKDIEIDEQKRLIAELRAQLDKR